MGRSVIIVVCGILVGLAIVWLVMSQVPGDADKVQPPNANAPYSGSRPVPNDPSGR